jgi:competence protein ComEA
VRGVPRRLATLLLLSLLALPPLWRTVAGRPRPPVPCAPEGRGRPPRHWLGCAGDPGPARAPADDERLLLGQPLDVNAAGAPALSFVPGLSARLAAAVVEDRARRGPFGAVEELLRVDGIGPVRLARARDALVVAPDVAPREAPR